MTGTRRERRPARPSRIVRVVRRAQRGVMNVAAVIGAVSILATVACLVFGIRPAIVVSGSMAPDMPVGSLTVARTVPAESVAVGDVVTVPRVRADGLVTHRVVETAPDPDDPGATRLVLQGDANDQPDALPYSVREAGRVLFVLPGVGYVVQAMQQNLVAVVAGLLAVTAFVAMPVGRRSTRAE